MRSLYYLLSCSICLLYIACRPSMLENSVSCDSANIPSFNVGHSKASQLQALMDQVVAEGVPGVALLVRDSEGTWIGQSGKADIDNNLKMMPCNSTRIASITKTMVVTTAMLLDEEGVLDIDNKIADYIDPKIVNHIDNADVATIRQCMNHSSGIFDHVTDINYQTSLLNNPTKKWTEEELVKFAYGHSAYFPPGTGVHYSNINTILVAMCIDKASGEYHGKLLHDLLFNPLGMQDSRYYYYDNLIPSTANGYFDVYGNGHIENVSNYNTGLGHTAVYSTVYDLQKFIEALLRTKTLVSTNSLAQMEIWLPDDSTTDFGLGLFRRDIANSTDKAKAGIGHTGGEFGYSGKCFYYPAADVTIISLCNYGTNIKTPIGDHYHDFHRSVEMLMMP